LFHFFAFVGVHTWSNAFVCVLFFLKHKIKAKHYSNTEECYTYDGRKSLEAMEFNHIPIWIHVSGLPMGMTNKEIVELIEKWAIHGCRQ